MSILIQVCFLSLCLVWLYNSNTTGAIVGIGFAFILINALSLYTWVFQDYRTINGSIFSLTLVISDLITWAASLYILFKRRKKNRTSTKHMIIISIPFILMILLQMIVSANSGIQR